MYPQTIKLARYIDIIVVLIKFFSYIYTGQSPVIFKMFGKSILKSTAILAAL